MAGGSKKRPPTALIAGIAGAVVVVIAIVVVLVLTLGGEKKSGPDPTAAPRSGPVGSGSASGGGSGGGSQSKAAANILVGEVAIPGSEYQCVVDAFDGDSALADAVVGGNADASEVADLLVGCVSGNTIADTVTKDFAGQVPSYQLDCFHSNVSAMDQGSLRELLAASIAGDLQSVQTILSYAAVGC